MRRGYYWIGHLPDGRHAILYSDPVLKDVHRQIAAFPTHIEAIRHCRKTRIALAERQSNVKLEKPKLPEHSLPRRQQVLYDQMLLLANADGIVKASNRELVEACGFTDPAALPAVLGSLRFKEIVIRLEAGYGPEPSTYKLAKQKSRPGGGG